MTHDYEMRQRFEEVFGSVIGEARIYEKRCLNATRWSGKAVLIVDDAALDSSGLKYFTVVLPRVKRFKEEFVEQGHLMTLADLSALRSNDDRLRAILNNERVWNVAIGIAEEIENIRRENGFKTDYEALNHWAKSARYNGWKVDVIGGIKGVGLITFQYLRMQAGVDTSMPNKIIKKVVSDTFGISAEDDISFISSMEYLSEKVGYSQILMCWAIWLKESDR